MCCVCVMCDFMCAMCITCVVCVTCVVCACLTTHEHTMRVCFCVRACAVSYGNQDVVGVGKQRIHQEHVGSHGEHQIEKGQDPHPHKVLGRP